MTLYYEDELVRLYHDDCREMLHECREYDHVVSDPPYDAATHANARSSATAGMAIRFAPLADPAALATLLMPKRWTLVFCSLEMLGDYRRGAGDRWVRSGVWDRRGGAPQFTGDRPAQGAEGIAIWHSSDAKRWNGGGKRAIWRHGVVSGPERVHETQKPIGLLRELILDFTDAGETIFDPFAGSGSVGVAAKECGRKAVLVEIDQSCCEIAAHRLAEATLDERVARIDGVRGRQGALRW